MQSPLEGVRVVEIANWAAAPSAGALLAEFGAEVIKVEPPTGDGMRGLMQQAAGNDEGIDHAFQFSNRAKASVAIDLSSSVGAGVAMDLAASADVVLLNLLPERRERMGLSIASIHERNPTAVVGVLTGFGEAGPDRNRPGFDLTAFFARSGLSASILGADDAVPRWRPAQGDHVAGLALFGGVMAGLYQRERTGEGQTIATSLLQAAAWTNAFDLTRAAADGRPPTAKPRTRSVNVTSEVFRCGDGRMIQLSMAEPVRGWDVLCEVLGWTELHDDPRFVDVVQRFKNMDELVGLVAAEFLHHDSGAVLAAIVERGGAAALVAHTNEVVVDPQVEALGLLRPVSHHSGDFQVVAAPFSLDAAGAERATKEPNPTAAFGSAGAETVDVLTRVLGLADAELQDLLDAGAVHDGR
jgi:crotonobetainyl-CoA:carnitine CoA-transferase CaiB-like acyl-CoA transferase